MAGAHEAGSTIPMRVTQLQEIRDSLDVVQQGVAALSSRRLHDSQTQTSLAVMRIELERSITQLNEAAKITQCSSIYQRTRSNTVRTKPPPAAAKVFGTFELLGMIFEYLHPLDLLRATQTCRAAANMIDSSRRIRRAMCLELDSDADELWPFHLENNISFATTGEVVVSENTLTARF